MRSQSFIVTSPAASEDDPVIPIYSPANLIAEGWVTCPRLLAGAREQNLNLGLSFSKSRAFLCIASLGVGP